jgi:elongation factor Ts
MAITAAQVKELRQKTGVGMMECKKALTENEGDLEKAIVWLRERGLSRAAKKADRVTAEGLVKVAVAENGKSGALVELNCETDFVSKNDDFLKFADDVSALALSHKVSDLEILKGLDLGGQSVAETLTHLIARIGENLNLRRVQYLEVSNGVVAGYSHMGGKIGSLIAVEGEGETLEDLGKDIAMHIAAAAPRYLDSTSVNTDELEQEKEIARKKLLEENKPEQLIEKILVGQVQKFYKEVCLVDQPFVKDPNVSVQKLVETTAKGSKISAFARFQLGEGIEKKQENFADEVAAQLK